MTAKQSILIRDFRNDRSGSTSIEYALTLVGFMLGGSSLASAFGGEIAILFTMIADTIGLEFCHMTYNP